ncbi:Protein of unknown function [Gryllus bimaculatus]|nr:Protein of unknown function [Gryllus bimaculatus]
MVHGCHWLLIFSCFVSMGMLNLPAIHIMLCPPIVFSVTPQCAQLIGKGQPVRRTSNKELFHGYQFENFEFTRKVTDWV